jgi:hypothetical protein
LSISWSTECGDEIEEERRTDKNDGFVVEDVEFFRDCCGECGCTDGKESSFGDD